MTIKQIIIFIILLLAVYGFLIEPNLITVKKLTLKSDEIKDLRIVFVSDFHLSKQAKSRLDRIIKKVNEQSPDVIISGGDYVIMHNAKFSMDMDYAAKKISEMKSKYGIYSVMGNHDYHKDNKYIKQALVKNGIKVLENENEKIMHNGNPIYIAGISDMQTSFYDLDKALKGTKPPIILVSHSPDITPKAKNRVNLVLSGHTHGGQVRIPFIGPVIVPSKYGSKYASGFVDNFTYTTKGLGTSILHLRFNCPPEILVIDYI